MHVINLTTLFSRSIYLLYVRISKQNTVNHTQISFSKIYYKSILRFKAIDYFIRMFEKKTIV